MIILPSFQAQLDSSITVFTMLKEQHALVEQIALDICQAVRDGSTLFTCGNGGSTADALHLAEELVGRYRANRRPLPAICLAADPTALTCIANDFGYDQIFSRQLEALARPGDVLVCLSTSGRSANIVNALKVGQQRAIRTIALLGKDGGLARGLADQEVIIASDESARIQEAHMQIVHYICEVIDQYEHHLEG